MKLEEPSPVLLHNIVVGLVGPYGAGCTSLVESLVRSFSDFPACLVHTVHVADLIKADYPIVIDKALDATDNVRPYVARTILQAAGTRLRKEDLEIVGRSIVARIFQAGRGLEQDGSLRDKKIMVFLVDSLKNLNDVTVLRRTFGHEFYLVSVHAPRLERWGRMTKYKSWTDNERAAFEECDKIDSDEKSVRPDIGDAGQQVSKVAATADYHIANTKNIQELSDDGERFVNFLFGYGLNQPTLDERFMHHAFSASNSSGCLSKQVGAAIVDSSGHIRGVGYNDVPKARGGLYTSGEDDKRCYQMGDSRCMNDTNKQERFDSLQSEINEAFTITENDKLKEVIWRSQFKESTEYCRAVHAEMEALLSMARSSSGSSVGTTMYVTTYPCHNCTKHILAAGVAKVVYIEPYPKSLAEELHGDAIIFDSPDINGVQNKLLFVPYQGVAPNRYEAFFTMREERKGKDGKLIRKTRSQAVDSPLFARELRRRSRTEPSNTTTQAEMNEFNTYTAYIQERIGMEGRHEQGGEG
jgi:deoxycytidylate deaminase